MSVLRIRRVLICTILGFILVATAATAGLKIQIAVARPNFSSAGASVGPECAAEWDALDQKILEGRATNYAGNWLTEYNELLQKWYSFCGSPDGANFGPYIPPRLLPPSGPVANFPQKGGVFEPSNKTDINPPGGNTHGPPSTSNAPPTSNTTTGSPPLKSTTGLHNLPINKAGGSNTAPNNPTILSTHHHKTSNLGQTSGSASTGNSTGR